MPKIPAKKNKTPWHLPSLPILIAVVIVSHIAYSCFTSDRVNANPALGKKLMPAGMQLVQKNKLHKSLEVFDQSIAADPYALTTYSNKAGILRMLGHHKEALEVLLEGDKKATAHHGEDYIELYYVKQGLFFLYSDMDDLNNALINIKRAVDLMPSADSYISWAGLDSIVSPPEERIGLYTKALELDPDHILAFCLCHHTLAWVGDWDKVNAEHAKVLEYQKKAMSLKKRTDTLCFQPNMVAYMNFTAEEVRDTAKLFALRETNVGQGEILPPLLPSQVPDQYDSDGKRVRKRIGYVSSDLQGSHPVGRNILGLALVGT